jgi:hypothetical protein
MLCFKFENSLRCKFPTHLPPNFRIEFHADNRMMHGMEHDFILIEDENEKIKKGIRNDTSSGEYVVEMDLIFKINNVFHFFFFVRF